MCVLCGVGYVNLWDVLPGVVYLGGGGDMVVQCRTMRVYILCTGMKDIHADGCWVHLVLEQG